MTDPDRIIAEGDRVADEIVQYTGEIVRIPTVNPPRDAYDTCSGTTTMSATSSSGPPMALLPALVSARTLALIGAGGMGEVYKARDTRLGCRRG